MAHPELPGKDPIRAGAAHGPAGLDAAAAGAAEGSGGSQRALAEFAERFGFRGARASQAYQDDPARLASAIELSGATIDSLARILAAGSGIPMERARRLCGLEGKLDLELRSPEEMPELRGASFMPSDSLVKVCGEPALGFGAAAHFAHEWAHAFDMTLGAGMGRAGVPSMPMGSIFHEVAKEMGSPSPYQAALGAMARSKLSMASPLNGYASVELSAPGAGAKAPVWMSSFSALVRALLPERARRLGAATRKLRLAESSSQRGKLSELIEQAAMACLAMEPEITDDPAMLGALSRFCARAVEQASTREGAARRGREIAIDSAKRDISTMLRMSMRLPQDSADRVSSAILHIAPIKAEFDAYYAAPYTGRSSWGTPASLADLSCALVRVCRNQRALENSKLAKERFVPMAFWWSMRRQVSEDAEGLEKATCAVLLSMSATGAAPSHVLAHAEQWGDERGDYKAGAAVFSDLVGTGSKMIRAEAELAGREVGSREALSIRRRISAPVNELARRRTVSESFAESFEQFVIAQARSRGPLARACREALRGSLVEPDTDERSAALDPAQAWMNNKDGDVDGNAKRWRALLRDVPRLIASARSMALAGADGSPWEATAERGAVPPSPPSMAKASFEKGPRERREERPGRSEPLRIRRTM